MEVKKFKYFILIALLALDLSAAAQTSYNGFPPPKPAAKPASKAEASASDAKTGEEKKSSQAQPQAQAEQAPGSTVNRFDPFMDNHLRAPEPGKKLGIFGKPIKEVEGILREYGAKNYSYAFGKYSRMSMSAYLITMYFDRNRRLAGVTIEPKPPYKGIAPEARKFFMDLFLKESGLQNFKALITQDRLELKYNPNSS